MRNTLMRQPAGKFEVRYPCPVCQVMMDKAQVRGRAGVLTLDHCNRCGGIWFERGEVQQLAIRKPDDLWAEVAPRSDAPPPLCPQCQTPVDRDTEQCGACHRKNTINCPHCDDPMTRKPVNNLVLDICERCHGVWFDHKELEAVWTLSLHAAAVARRTPRGGEALAVGGDVLLSAMFWTPGLVVHGAVGAAHLGGAAIEAAGGAAEGVFDAILEFISSLFE